MPAERQVMARCDIRASFVVVQRWGFCMSVLQHRLLNGWPLFFMIALFSALIMTIGIWLIGVATVEEILALLRLSVQISAPWIYITFIASSLVRLYPNKTSRWVLRNRRYFGLSFAAAMGWQMLFIIVLFSAYMPYYMEVLHKTSDLILRTAAYIVLFAMTITSFYPVRQRMRQQHWRWLHFFGVWLMFLSMWVSYASIVFIEQSTIVAYVLFILGSIALVVRLAAYRLSLQSTEN